MKITHIEVDAFGVWSRLSLAGLSDQCTVFYGPNEAGKSTLMQFVRSLLYGFSPERRARFLPPLAPGRPGGRLRVADADRSLVIGRYAGDTPGDDQLVVLDRAGTELSPHELADLLHGVDDVVFNNVFAFGLREIQELNTLSDTQASHLLYELTLGLDRVSLADVMGELEAARNRLLTAEGRPGQITQMLAARARARTEAGELAAPLPRYLDLVGQRDRIAQAVRQLDADEAQLASRGRQLQWAAQLAPRWRQRAAVEQRLAALGNVESLPDNALFTLDALVADIKTTRKRRRWCRRRRRQLRSQARGIVVNEILCRQAPRIEALGEQQQWILALAKRLQRLEEELTNSSVPSAASSDKIPLPTPPLTRPVVATLRGHARLLSQLRKHVQHAHGEVGRAQQAAAGCVDQVRAGLGTPADSQEAPEANLTRSLESAGELVSKLRRRVQLDERLDQMDRRQHELVEKNQACLDRQLMPAWQLVALGGVFALGFAMLLAGLCLPASIVGSLGWPLALLGLVGSGAAGAAKVGVERLAGRQMSDGQKQFGQLQQQIDHAKQERDALDAQLPRGGGPLVARLQTAEKELARLEALMPLESQRSAAVQSHVTARNKRDAAAAEFKKARNRWTQMLAQAGLPAEVRPRHLRAIVARGRQSQAAQRRNQQRQAELAETQTQHDALAQRIHQLAEEAGLRSPELEALAQLRGLLAHLQDHQSRRIERHKLYRRARRLRHKQVAVVRQLDELRRQHHALILSASAGNEAEFRRRAIAQAEARQLQAEHAQLETEITAAIPHDADLPLLTEWLDGGHDLDQMFFDLETERQALRTRLDRLHAERGALEQQLATLASDRRLANHQLDANVMDRRLQAAVARWRVLAVCGRALDHVREVYERERQPEALSEASGYFDRLTAGRHKRIWTPLGRRELHVDDASGRSIPVALLSRGTREQLFLSLRLAIVTAYARRGIRLPLVLDDVLVNFDAPRAKAAVGLLRDFARAGHQILIFTCHEHIARLFRGAKIEVRELPANYLRPESQPRALEPPAPEPPAAAIEPEPKNVVPAPHFLPVAVVELPPEPEPELEPVELEVSAPAAVRPRAARIPRARRQRPAPPAEVIVPMEFVNSVESGGSVDSVVLPAAERVVPLPARPPQPVRKPRIERIHWSAEEFDGELADRVRRDEATAGFETQTWVSSTTRVVEDEPLFEVEFDEDSHKSK